MLEFVQFQLLSHKILSRQRKGKKGKGFEEVGFVRRSTFKRFWINLFETLSTCFDGGAFGAMKIFHILSFSDVLKA